MRKSKRKLQKRRLSKEITSSTKLTTPVPRLHSIARSIRHVLIAATVGSATLPLEAQALTCPITGLETLSTPDTNSVFCQITSTGQLDIQALGGALTNNIGGTLSNGGQLNNLGSLNNQYGGTLNNEAGGTLNNSGVLTNFGVVNNTGTLNNAGTLANSYTFYNSGTINNQAGGLLDASSYNFFSSGTLNNQAGATVRVTRSLVNEAGGAFNNDGALLNHFYLNNYGALVNNDLFENGLPIGPGDDEIPIGIVDGFINGGSVVNNATLTNHARITNFAAGTIDNSATGVLTSHTFLENAGTLNNAGVLNNVYSGLWSYDGQVVGRLNNSGTLNNLSGGTLNNGGLINNTGTLNNKAGSTLDNTGSIESDGLILNEGSFNVASTGSVTGDGAFVQSEGNTVVDGSLDQASVSITGGVLGGTGVVTSSGVPVDIDPDAILDPGSSTGILTFGSDVDFDGAMILEVAGLTNFDQINVFGVIDFGLNSEITFDFEDYMPSVGDRFELLFSDTLTGFDNITYNTLGLGSGINYAVFLDSGNTLGIEFSAVPVPAAVWLFGSGLAGLVGVARKRKAA